MNGIDSTGSPGLGPIRLDWTWMGVGSYVAAGAGTVVLGAVAIATLPATAGALVVAGVVGGTALWVAAAAAWASTRT